MATGRRKLLDIIKDSGKSISGFVKQAKSWFSQKILDKKGSVTQKSFDNWKERHEPKVKIGHMYHYVYDAKHKKTLPYWDAYPLVFPIGFYNDGFLGINLHYLPIKLRAELMDALLETASNNRFDEDTKLKISYNILNGATKYDLFRPCIKRYLYSHVKGDFIHIKPAEWRLVLFLPTAKFKKKKEEKVWKDSKKMIKKHRKRK